MPALITNCSNNYGPYQHPEKLIPLMIIHALEGKPLPIYGDGSNVRDWLHVSDHCDALMAVVERGRIGETYNVGGGNERNNRDVVGAICDTIDRAFAGMLAAFGAAFGKLPGVRGDQPGAAQSSCRQAATGLSQESKVFCVRLALFAEMMKGKTWTPATLKEVGGTEGVGVTFLEETFSAPDRPPASAAPESGQAVLKALLPESGTDIKGHMRSQVPEVASVGLCQPSEGF